MSAATGCSTVRPSEAIFVCSRSGVHRPSGSGQRRLKSQGSAKLGMMCTSALHLQPQSDRGGGGVSAVLYPHHHGHSTGVANLPHLRIPASDRAMAKGNDRRHFLLTFRVHFDSGVQTLCQISAKINILIATSCESAYCSPYCHPLSI